MKVEEAAYIAGIIDGDGTIGIHLKTVNKGNSHYQSWMYYVAICLTNKQFLDSIKVIINPDQTHVYHNPRNLKGRASPSFRLQCSGSHCISLLKEIRPYLRLKSPQADVILAFAGKQQEAQSQRGGQGLRYPDWYHELAVDTEKQIRKLNRRGIDRQAAF